VNNPGDAAMLIHQILQSSDNVFTVTATTSPIPTSAAENPAMSPLLHGVWELRDTYAAGVFAWNLANQLPSVAS
jgi:hypothetical protein